jgi:5-(carboxyamino)imidazole ribonucleotide synthase
MSTRFPTVGVIGAGEVARMLVGPAASLGVTLKLFAQSSNEPGAKICGHIVGDHRDLNSLKEFAEQCDLLTVEDGSLPLSVIKVLEGSGIRIYPTSASLHKAKDREKRENKFSSFDCEISVLVSRSPHGQATVWSVTEVIKGEGESGVTITPAPNLTADQTSAAQKVALDLAQELGVIGVMAVELLVKSEEIEITKISMGPHFSGNWTIDASRTSQFEQHLRAILDLPLGDPSMTFAFAVTGKIIAGEKSDMYRPYLHLMARSPDLKFHQYMNEPAPGQIVGHMTASGSNLLALREDLEHARDYMSGEIDE